jgi:hypothetical protein
VEARTRPSQTAHQRKLAFPMRKNQLSPHPMYQKPSKTCRKSVSAVSRRIARGADAVVPAIKPKHKRPGLNLFVRFIALVAVGLVSTFGYDYKVTSDGDRFL